MVNDIIEQTSRAHAKIGGGTFGTPFQYDLFIDRVHNVAEWLKHKRYLKTGCENSTLMSAVLIEIVAEGSTLFDTRNRNYWHTTAGGPSYTMLQMLDRMLRSGLVYQSVNSKDMLLSKELVVLTPKLQIPKETTVEEGLRRL